MAARKKKPFKTLYAAGARQPEQGDIGRLVELRAAGVIQGTQIGELMRLRRDHGNNPLVDILVEKARGKP